MKKLLISTAAIALLFGAASAAPGDNNDNDRHKGHERTNTMSGPANNTKDNNMQGPANNNANTMQAPKTDATPRDNGQRNLGFGTNKTAPNTTNDNDRNKKPDFGDKARAKGDQLRDNNNNNNNRNADPNRDRQRNVDVSKYRKNFRATRRFHAQTYHGPRGYHYQRWTYGQRLPSVYWARDYWLMDFLTFGLFAPPDGYTWVRYGNDALLIDEYTGDIVQVQYDVFY